MISPISCLYWELGMNRTRTRCGRNNRVDKTGAASGNLEGDKFRDCVQGHNGVRCSGQNEAVGGDMSACNFEHLLQFVNNQLDLDKRLEIYNHLDGCDICRDAVHQLSRDMAGALRIYCAHCVKQYARHRQIKTAWHGRAHVSANTLARRAVRRISSRPGWLRCGLCFF